MVTTPSAPKQWVHCTAIPVAAEELSYYTYYGPGELETFRHMQLHAEVKLAKLKIWYPGVWHRPSPRALFRMHINNPARNGTDDLVLLHFLSNSNIIVATCQYSKGQCRESRKIRWKSTTMNIGTLQGENEKLYKHNLLYFANSEEEESSGEVNKDFLMDSDAEDCSNFCVTMELDSRGEDYSASRELSSDEECSVSHLYAPPCISLLRPDESTICKVEWRPVLHYESTRSQGAAEMNRIQNVSSTTRYDYHHAPSNEDKEKSLWLFPHQVDLRKVTTVHPTYIERNKTQTSKYNEIICDFGRELLGHVKINNLASSSSSSSSSSSHTSSSFVGQTIQLRVGETLPEALNDNEEHFEQSVDLCANIDEDGTVLWWSSSHLVAFRFVRVIIASDDIDLDKLSVACLSSEPELNNLGSLDFGSNVSDDNLLDKKIWDCSLKTLKLCIHRNFIVDGIKRDRLPWLGDVIVSLLANAYSYHDEECIRWTLSVLGRCGMEKLYSNSNSSADDVDTARINVAESHVNGILDYSLWLFICHWLYQRYFGDVIFLRQEWPLLETRLMNLVTWCSDKENGWFIEHKNEWVFIDWTVEGEKSVPLQIVWWWALDCASNLAESADVDKSKDDVEKKAHDEAERVIASIQDVQAKLETSLLESDDIQKGYKRHAHLLGVLSGLYSRLDERASGDWWNPDTSDERVHIIKKCRKLIEGSREALLGKDLASVATPYMKNLECMALIRLGERRAAIEKVRAYWGGMLRTDATTFYEAFNEKETATDVAAFYERPFARSLCHAWSAGPCALYQEILLGIRPLSNGWKEWSCSPLDDVVTVSASIKTAFGKIEVSLDPTQLRVRVPDRTTMKLMNKSYGGGMHCIPRSVLISSESVRAWSKKYRDWHYHDEHVIPPNPIIGGHEGIQMTDVPTVFQLPGDAEKFYMSFVGFDGVGYQTFIAESTNLVQWRNLKLAMGYGEEGAFDHGGVVLGAYLYESYSIDAPRILKKMVDDNFISLYGAYKKKNQYEADPGFQGLAVSLNGLYWKRGHDESILSIYGRPGEIKDWEKDSIYQPWLIEHNGMYYNFYNAKQMPAWIEQIGIATSLNLLQWERHTDNPIICVCKDGFDTQFCSDPKVFWDEKENHWVMFFYGVGRGAAHIMIAFSRDLHHWERDKTPLYQAGGNPSGIDNRYAHKVSIVFNHSNETFYMFYCAVGDGGRGIGLITSKPLRGC